MITYSMNKIQNIRKLFHFLEQFPFITSEMKLDYYQKKGNISINSQVTEKYFRRWGGMMPTQEKKDLILTLIYLIS